MTELQKFAVFDVDGTIFRSSLFMEVMEELVALGILPKEAKDIYYNKYKKWKDREGGYSEYADAMVVSFCKYIKGVHYGDFADVARSVIDRQQKHTYKYTRNLLKKLKSDGYYLLAISHSQKTVLDMFCPSLGFDKVYGMIYEIGPGDMFTGLKIDEHIILNKANVLRRAIKKEGLDLEGSIAVGDTHSDIPMLEMVERAICFNPSSELYKQAQIRGWEVVVERKDVVYNLSKLA